MRLFPGSLPRRLGMAVVAMCLAAVALLITRSEATTLTLDTGKSLGLAPGGSGTFTFTTTNDAGAITENFLAWTIGIQVLPAGSPVGTLTIGALSQPGTNPLPAGEVDLTQPTLATLAGGATINGTSQYYLTNASATGFLNTVDSNGFYNLGALSLSASGDAQGTWNVYAVQQGGSFYKTYWTDAALDDVDFGNLPRGSSGSNTSLLIGTVTVSAVPEPVAFALAGTGVVCAIWGARRLRKKRAAATGQDR